MKKLQELWAGLDFGHLEPFGAFVFMAYLFVTAVVVGAWRLFVFYREDRFFPKIEFLCDVLFKVERTNEWLVEIVCVVRNKGITGLRVRDLSFRVHALYPTDELKVGDEAINGQIKFPHLAHRGRWKFRPEMNVRVEPSTAQFFRHVAKIDKSIEAIVLHGNMVYRQKRYWWFGRPVTHTCNRLIRIPVNSEEAAQIQDPARLTLQFAGDHDAHEFGRSPKSW